jgi:hypothetical protein
MSDKTNQRDAAISGFRQREAEAARDLSDRTRNEQERARQQTANLTAWATLAFPAISTGVTQANDDFARRGSPFLVRQTPDGRPGFATYEIHQSGNLRREAALVFELHSDGIVRAGTDARGADFPAGVAVNSVTHQWAEQAAEKVIIAVLGGQRMPVPDDDFIKDGLQTRVPNQPRTGRTRSRDD